MDKGYPYKVWITAQGIGAFLIILLVFIRGGGELYPGFLLLFVYSIFYGSIFSLPIVFLFYLACKEFVSYRLSENTVKLLLALIAIVGMLFTLYLVIGKGVFSTNDDMGIVLPIC